MRACTYAFICLCVCSAGLPGGQGFSALCVGGRKKTAIGLGLGTELSQCPPLLEILCGLFLSNPPFRDRWETKLPFPLQRRFCSCSSSHAGRGAMLQIPDSV